MKYPNIGDFLWVEQTKNTNKQPAVEISFEITHKEANEHKRKNTDTNTNTLSLSPTNTHTVRNTDIYKHTHSQTHTQRHTVTHTQANTNLKTKRLRHIHSNEH